MVGDLRNHLLSQMCSSWWEQWELYGKLVGRVNEDVRGHGIPAVMFVQNTLGPACWTRVASVATELWGLWESPAAKWSGFKLEFWKRDPKLDFFSSSATWDASASRQRGRVFESAQASPLFSFWGCKYRYQQSLQSRLQWKGLCA